MILKSIDETWWVIHPCFVEDGAADKITSPLYSMKEGRLSFHIYLLLSIYINTCNYYNVIMGRLNPFVETGTVPANTVLFLHEWLFLFCVVVFVLLHYELCWLLCCCICIAIPNLPVGPGFEAVYLHSLVIWASLTARIHKTFRPKTRLINALKWASNFIYFNSCKPILLTNIYTPALSVVFPHEWLHVKAH